MAGLTSEPSHLSSRAAVRLPAFRSPFSFWADISKGRFPNEEMRAPILFCTNESRICQEAGIGVAVRIQSYRRINPSHDPLDWSWYFEYA